MTIDQLVLQKATYIFKMTYICKKKIVSILTVEVESTIKKKNLKM